MQQAPSTVQGVYNNGMHALHAFDVVRELDRRDRTQAHNANRSNNTVIHLSSIALRLATICNTLTVSRINKHFNSVQANTDHLRRFLLAHNKH